MTVKTKPEQNPRTGEALAHARCFNHATREAVARCLECGRYYCRECITEHDERVICAVCLRRLSARGPARVWANLLALWRVLQAGAGLLTLWLFFYLIARLLLLIPDSFHEGTIWLDAPPTTQEEMKND